ncbi:MAG: hypothetical protein K8J31_21630 [Anaerolineae bacterium]|nr:hypothetical protein [Anaerolineae bacterium]
MTKRCGMMSLLMLVIVWIGRPVQAQVDVGCGPSLPLAAGLHVNTRPGIYIRNLPTRSGGIAEYLQDSLTFQIVEGPACADGLNWWRVTGPSNINPGWIAEKEAPDGRYLIFKVEVDPATLCPDPLNLVSGSHMPLLNDVRIRQEPTLEGLVLHVAPQGDTATIVGGPQCVEMLNWWQVQVTWQGILIQGWMAEGQYGATFVTDPDLPSPDKVCGPPMRLHLGDRASVNVEDYKPKNLRVAPGLDGTLLYSLIEGIAFDVLEGPVCADNLNWWKIQIVSRPEVIGWLSEGGPGNRAIKRFTQDRLPGH